MTHLDKEVWVSRILAGYARVRIGKKAYIFRSPTTFERAMAAQIAQEEADLAEGMLTKSLDWSDEDEALLTQCEKDIEDLKVNLYESAYKEVENAMHRNLLSQAKEQLSKLFSRKHKMDHLTVEGHMHMARTRYLVGRTLLHENLKQVWQENAFWRSRGSLLDNAVHAYNASRANETIIRELARTEPWRSVWSCRHSESSVFGVPAANLNDEQRMLVMWSRIYDNVSEDDASPARFIIDDDDMLDGWFIVRRREQEKAMALKHGERLTANAKIGQAQEVYICNALPGQETSSLSEAERKRIDESNSLEAKIKKARRAREVEKKGVVHVLEMPDVLEDIQMELTRKQRNGQ